MTRCCHSEVQLDTIDLLAATNLRESGIMAG